MSQSAAEFGWLSQAKGLVAEIRSLSRRRVGTVVGVTVGAPEAVPTEDLVAFLMEQLPDCEISVRFKPGPLRLLAVEGRR